MKMLSNYARNFMIYYNNLSTYYVICVLMSIIAVVLSWVYHFKNVPPGSDFAEREKISEKKVISKESLEINKTEDSELKHIFNSFKESKKQAMEKYAATLTEDQRKEEKEVEREQLAAILKLLKDKEDKFQVSSMEELEGQLKLYRY